MEKEYYNTFNLGRQSLHFISNENNPGIGMKIPLLQALVWKQKTEA